MGNLPIPFWWARNHASALTAATKIPTIEFQNQQAPTIRSLAFSPVDGRPQPVSGSMLEQVGVHFEWFLPFFKISDLKS